MRALRPGDLVVTPTGHGATVLAVFPECDHDPWPRAKILTTQHGASVCTVRCELLVLWPLVTRRKPRPQPVPPRCPPPKVIGPNTLRLPKRC